MKKIFLLLTLVLLSCSSISSRDQYKKQSSKFYLFFCSAGTYSELNFKVFNEIMNTNYERNAFLVGNGVYNINDSTNLLSYYITENNSTYISVCSFSHDNFNSAIYLKETQNTGIDLTYNRKDDYPTFKVKLYEKNMKEKSIIKKYTSTYNLKYDIVTKKFVFDKQLVDFVK